MPRKKRPAEDHKPTPLTVTLKAHIVNDLKKMEKTSKRSVDDLVSTAVLMFIATHKDYLGEDSLGT